MVVVASTETRPLLPQLTLESMTKNQLEEFIPELVTKVTGRDSPQFGSLKDKPDWWPGDLEWTNPEQLSDIYQDPCEKLREIVRSGYFHMDQDSLLDSSDLTDFNVAELPQSPATEDTQTTGEVGDGKESRKMTISCESPCIIELEDSMDCDDAKTQTQDKHVDDVFVDDIIDLGSDVDRGSGSTSKVGQRSQSVIMKNHSATSRLESKSVIKNNVGKSSYNEMKSLLKSTKDGGSSSNVSNNVDKSVDGTSEVVKEFDNLMGRAINKMTADNGGDITQDVIAQIDEHIANSLKVAFSNIQGINQSSSSCARQGSPLGFEHSAVLDKLTNRKKLVGRRHSSDSVPDNERRMPEPRKTFPKYTDTKSEVNLGRPNVQGSGVVPQARKIDNEHKDHVKTSNTGTASKDTPNAKDEKNEDEVVWICFVCAKGFPDQVTLVKHQDVCEDPPASTSCDAGPPKPASTSSAIGTLASTLSSPSLTNQTLSEMLTGRCPLVDVSQSGNGIVSETKYLGKPVPTLLRKVGSNLKSLPLGLPTKPKCTRRGVRKFPDIYIPPKRDLYFESLGLVPAQKAAEITQSPRKSFEDEDCQIIDLTMDDQVPVTPRTPRSLMSQLSRDEGSGRRRQLSFSSPSQAQKTVKPTVTEESDSSSESSADEITAPQHKVPSKTAILAIPLTSPLGQRLKKHWSSEDQVPTVGDVEQFCKTDRATLLLPEEKVRKGAMVEKLRNRPPPQCTFRFTKKYMNKWFHYYKFNRADKHEFEKTLRWGLNRESSLKFKRMTKCNVALSRVSAKDIKYWTTPRGQKPRRFLPDTSSLQQYNKRVRQGQVQHQAMHSRNQPQYLQPVGLYQMPVQLRPVGPTPQLLVRTEAMGGDQGMRLHVLPVQEAALHHANAMLNSQNQPPVAGSSKRKQVFTNVRADDNMVICLSSDEEDDVASKPPSNAKSVIVCAACKVNKDTCKIHGKKRIGPASYLQRQQSKPSAPCNSPARVNSPANIIAQSQKPVSVSQQFTYSNTASAKVFGTSLMPATSFQPVLAPVPSTMNGNMVKCRISDGKISNFSTMQTPIMQIAPSTMQIAPLSMQTAPPTLQKTPPTMQTAPPLMLVPIAQIEGVKTETTSQPGNSEVNQPSDSEYMDFEVICIDSEDDE